MKKQSIGTCQICGVEFTASRRGVRFCSKRCADRAWYIANRDHRLKKNREYRQDPMNAQRIRSLVQRWNAENTQHRKSYREERRHIAAEAKYKKYHSDLCFRLGQILRSRIYHALRSREHENTSSSLIELLGCSLKELKLYIESKFKPGMSWDNYGRGGWHIDHVRPLSSFDLNDPKQLCEACHYTNLQPLWAHENLKKGCKT